MKIEQTSWGRLEDGREVLRFEIKNSNGISAAVINYGAVIQQICAPDRSGQTEDIVLGYDSLNEYIQGSDYFGASVGRVSNRIAGAAFELEGNRYQLTANEGANMLHGGSGFHTKLWDYEILENALVLNYISEDGEDGFPGSLKVTQTITLSEENALRLEYKAVCDKTTICSLTGHSYFNLAGSKDGKMQSVFGHQMQLAAKEYTPGGDFLIPTGEILSVEETAYDFLGARALGDDPLDVNFVLSDAFKKWDVRVYEPVSGRFLSLKTDLPGLQVYNGSGIAVQKGKGGIQYGPFAGLALEPQFYPDAIHHKNFPQPILKAGEEYRHFIEYHFGVV